MVPWGQRGLELQETCFTFADIHVDPLVHEVYYLQVIPQHPLDPRVPGFQGCQEFQLHREHEVYLQEPFFKACLGML